MVILRFEIIDFSIRALLQRLLDNLVALLVAAHADHPRHRVEVVALDLAARIDGLRDHVLIFECIQATYTYKAILSLEVSS